jgi:DNA-binding beta-propeller fold protein YncE
MNDYEPVNDQRCIKAISAVLLLLLFSISTLGCVSPSEERREPLPEIMWPKPPEIPRIYFVDAISRPEDLYIKENPVKRFFKFFIGGQEGGRESVKPYGVETDSEGRYYVVDSFSKCVHVYDEKEKIYFRFPQDDTAFELPVDMAIDGKGVIFVPDSNDAVVKVFKEYGRTFDGEIGKGILKRPAGIAVNEKTGELLVVDTGNSQILRYDIDSRTLRGTVGSEGSEEGMFNYPTNIFVSKSGRIFVTDSLNFRIQIFSPEWEFIDSFGKVGNNPGFFSRPKGIAVDSDDNIYVVDALFDNIQVFNSKGKLLMDFGGPGHEYGQFWLPSGIFIDSSDRIYVSDTYNRRIQVFQYITSGEL